MEMHVQDVEEENIQVQETHQQVVHHVQMQQEYMHGVETDVQ